MRRIPEDQAESPKRSFRPLIWLTLVFMVLLGVLAWPGIVDFWNRVNTREERAETGEGSTNPAPPSRQQSPIRVGQAAPNLIWRDLQGETVRLRELLGSRPLVVEFGSGTCPLCRSQAEGMEALSKKYHGQVDFIFIYGREAHPEFNDPDFAKKAPPTFDRRRETVRQFLDEMGTSRRIALDEITPNNCEDQLGGFPNPTMVIGRDERIGLLMTVTNSWALDQFLPEYLQGGSRFNRDLSNKVFQSPPNMIFNPSKD